MSLNPRWHKEDRALPTAEYAAAKEATEKAVRGSSLIVRLLTKILNEDIEKTFSVEENFDDPAWGRKTIAAASERKVLRRIIKLLP